MSQPYKRLYRSREETMLTGVCGGLGVYFEVDPVLMRLIFIVATLFTGLIPGVAVYLLAWLIIPLEPLPLYAQAPPQQAQQPNS